MLIDSKQLRFYGGEGGIRTPDSLATMSDFESDIVFENRQCS